MRSRTSKPVSRSPSWRGRRRLLRATYLVACLGLAGLAGFFAGTEPQSFVAPVPEGRGPVPIAAAAHDASLLDPAAVLGSAAGTRSWTAPLDSGFRPHPGSFASLAVPPVPIVKPVEAVPLATPTSRETAAAPEPAPLPVPRPADLTRPGLAEAPRPAERQPLRRPRVASAPAAAADTRNFIERLFGLPVPHGTALAYAPSGDGTADRGPGRRANPILPDAAPGASPGTAIYDIGARVVILPNGERLEAHSGLGEKMDDVRHAHVRMHGPTPPHVYLLSEREALFHGVRAIRLTPVGGSGAIFGRAGLLAHSYLLGPRGDSNGCVSVKDYERFLQAYLRGEIRRLVVVAGRG